MAQKRKRSKKWIYYLFMLVLLIAAGVVVYLVWDNYFNDKKTEDRKEQAVVEEAKSETKEDTVANNSSDPETDDKKPVQYEGEDPNEAEELSGSITYAGLINDRITVRVNIDQYLNEGKCVIHLINNGVESYSEAANIVSSAATSTCEGFDISAASFTSGKYEILIDLSSGEKKGTIRGEINI